MGASDGNEGGACADLEEFLEQPLCVTVRLRSRGGGGLVGGRSHPTSLLSAPHA